MMLRRFLVLTFFFSAAALFVPPVVEAGEILQPAASAEEIALARTLAEEAMVAQGIGLSEQVYFVTADRIYDKVNRSAKKILITHFKYEGRTTIASLVDLDLRKVESLRQEQDAETDISLDELAIAEQMARALPEVDAMQRGFEEPLVAEPFQFSGWLYDAETRSNRVVGIQFYKPPASHGDAYILELGTVVVDLERRSAWIDPATPGASGPDPLEVLVINHLAAGNSAAAALPAKKANTLEESTTTAAVQEETTEEASLPVAKGEER